MANKQFWVTYKIGSQQYSRDVFMDSNASEAEIARYIQEKAHCSGRIEIVEIKR